MSARIRTVVSVLVLVLVIVPMLVGCGATSTPVPTAAPTAAAKPTQAAAPTTAPATQAPAPTAAPPTATKVPEPKIGGTLVRATGFEPNSLDPHKTSTDAAAFIQTYFGASLIALEPGTGKYVPYLASAWKISEDGLTWTFTLKQGVKFSDGAPFTAKDYAYTFTRALDPSTKALVTKDFLDGVVSAEATDDYTLEIKFAQPSAAFLTFLTNQAWMQPVEKAAVDKLGDAQFGRTPTGVGPYVVKEWVTGDRVTLERNPDYKWGPAFAQGQYYIQTLVFRFITDYSTIVAGLESGEIDWSEVQPKDLEKLKTKFVINEVPIMGIEPFIAMNTTKAPFDDVRVRQALNLAVDRDALIKVVMLGAAAPQYGPLSINTPAYWSGVEKIGYHFDLTRAQSLMKDAGYTLGSSGFLEKGGQPLKVGLAFASGSGTGAQVCQILKEQWKALGVDVTLQQGEAASMGAQIRAGEYDMFMNGLTYPDPGVLVYMFSSGFVGTALNGSRVSNPELDELLSASSVEMDTAKRTDLFAKAQQIVVEQAYLVTLYAGKTLHAVSTRVKGAVFSPGDQEMLLWLDKAYVETK